MEAAAAVREVHADGEEPEPADVGEADGRLQQGRQPMAHRSRSLARSTTCFWVVAKHQAEDEDDQSEQRAQHDDGAHVPTPSKRAPDRFR